MSQQLLIESIHPHEGNLISESSTDGKNCYLTGVFMQADIRNRNGRIYPLHEMVRAVSDLSSRISEYGGVFGEADHPASLTLNMDRISHVITEVNMSGSNVIGKARVIKETPMGKILQVLIDTGVKIGVSSRGTGNVSEGGNVSDFNIVTVDAVLTPSAPGAIPTSVYESLDVDKNGKQVILLSEALRHDKTAQKYFQKEINKFIRNLIHK